MMSQRAQQRMTGRWLLFFGCAATLSVTGLVVSGGARAALAGLTALSSIEGGLWDVRSKDGRDGGRTMCLQDPGDLLQLGHPGLSCSRFAIKNLPTEAVVHYRCPGSGSGQTSLRVETPRLLQIETQGIAHQAPFSFQFEARRLGACNATRK